ncbi:MAG: class I SAM-dependent methyltransferase [Clostridiales bacterium]|nr:class I SAM-dependent methyltransferase [Clostridiales bacterium]
MNQEVIAHYDQLIDENNDPVHDPPALQAYMNQWDGSAFLDMLSLELWHSVLEIGVGTGRLALRVAPRCKNFTGIDISPKTVERGKSNLAHCKNAHLICGDFMDYPFGASFDRIYSSLTFMHIQRKQAAIQKVASLLSEHGLFVLSIDKNQSSSIDMGTRRIVIYPDQPDEILLYMRKAGFILLDRVETPFAHILVAQAPYHKNGG